jgi:PTS system nitrogen regulatory IIA component
MHLNVIQLAESFGVEESVVASWVRNDGLPAIEDRGRLLFDRAQVVDWAASRGLAAKAGFLAAGRPAASSGGRLESLLRTGGIWREVPAAEVVRHLEQIVTKLPATPQVRQMLAQRLLAPDGITWAPVGGGLALPHLRSHVALGRDSGLLAILFLRDAAPLPEAAPDGVPVTRLLFFVAPSPRAHLEILAQLSGALSRGTLRGVLMEGGSDEQIFSALSAAEKPMSKEGQP